MKIKSVLLFSLGPLGNALLSLGALPIVAWYFEPEDIGRFSILQILITFSFLIFSLGLEQAYVRDYHSANKKGELLKATLFPGLIFLTVFISLSLPYANYISQFIFSINSYKLGVLLLILILLSFVVRFFLLTVRMKEMGGVFSLIQIQPKLILLLFIAAASSFDFKFNFSLMLLSQVISYGVSIVAVTVLLKNHITSALSSTFNSKIFIESLRFGSPLVVSSLCLWATSSLDRILLKEYTDLNTLAIYTMAVNFAGAALIFQVVFSTVWGPQVYKAIARGNCTKFIDKVTINIVYFAGIFFSLTALFSWCVPLFLPDTYAGVEKIIVCAMAYPLFYTMSECTSIGLSIKKRSDLITYTTFVALLLNFSLNFVLIPMLGEKGAAISSVVSFWVLFMLKTYFSSRLYKQKLGTEIYVITFIFFVVCVFTPLIPVRFAYIINMLWLALLVYCGLGVFRHNKSFIVDMLKRWKFENNNSSN